jgi:hypothetical protein
MLVIDATVRAAHARRDLNAGLCYAVVRLAELLDPDTPFALSACAYCDPLAATGAFESAARDHLANPGVRFGTVLAASQLLSDALAQEGNLRAWYPGDLKRLLLFLGRLREVPAVKTVGERQVRVPFHERTTWVRQRLGGLADGSLGRFRAAIADPVGGYRARLVDQLAGRLCTEPADERGWAELEHDLCYVAALLLGEGRDGGELARAIAAGVADAPDVSAAVRAVREVAASEASPYQVALVLSGAGSLDAEPAAALGIGVIERDRPRWAVSALDPPAAAARALRDFVDGRATRGEATPLLVRVEAWDPEQARLRALLAAESVRDHLVAEHPGADFSLGAEALVLNVAAGTARRAGGAPRTVRRGRAPRSVNPPGLLPFLRANALARAAVSPALRVLHTWIALECLTRDGGRDGAEPGERPALNLKLESYLPPHLASVAAMAGLRALLVTSWDEVRGLALRSPRREDWLRVEEAPRPAGHAAARPRRGGASGGAAGRHRTVPGPAAGRPGPPVRPRQPAGQGRRGDTGPDADRDREAQAGPPPHGPSRVRRLRRHAGTGAGRGQAAGQHVRGPAAVARPRRRAGGRRGGGTPVARAQPGRLALSGRAGPRRGPPAPPREGVRRTLPQLGEGEN